jgi:DNA polymerase III delta subunit
MIHIILTGDDETKLFAREQVLISEMVGQGKVLIRLPLHTLKPADLEEKMGRQSLFGGERALLVTGWEKLRSPKQQTELLDALAASPDDVLITIPQSLTPAQQKKLGPPWRVENLALPKTLFTFLSAIKQQPLIKVHEMLMQLQADGQNEWGIQALLSRQITGILAAKVGAPVPGAPFQITQWQRQSTRWTVDELQWFINELANLEDRLKTGRSYETWWQAVDRLLCKLYDR